MAASDDTFPDYPTRQKIEKGVAKSVREHLIVYTTHDRSTQYWQWVKREPGQPDRTRTHIYHRRQSGEALSQKLQRLAIALDEEEAVTLVKVTGRVRAAFDVEKVTKGFYDRFKKEHTAFLTYDLAKTLRHADVTVIGGFQSPMEKECLDVLLRGTASVVVCPARGFNHVRTPKSWKPPIAEGRLLLLSFFDGNVRRPTAALAAKRNAHVATLANRLLIAHAEPDSKTETLCRDALTQGKPVFTLDSPDNACLIELGALPVPADDLTALFA